MTRHRMRLVERLIEEDSGDFLVDAPTPALAAGILLAAHDRAREQDSNLVTLPDGQRRRIEPTNVVENITFCMLLDETGREIKEIDPEWESDTTNERQQDARCVRGSGQAGAVEPGS